MPGRFAVGGALNLDEAAIAGDEERGLLDQRLAQPVSRTSVVIQQFLWLSAGVLILTIVLLATVGLGGRPFDLNVNFMNLLAISVSTGLFGLLFGVMSLVLVVRPQGLFGRAPPRKI